MPFYYNNPKFSSLNFMGLEDRQLISFMIEEDFNVNKEWCRENPVLHFLLANEMFPEFRRFLHLIPGRINPNLCDGERYGRKSLLIILIMLVSNGTLPLFFIKLYEKQLNFDYQDNSGRTVLHYAVILGRYDIVDALMTLGVSVSLQDKYGKCAFEYLSCAASCIDSVLKQIDIEPFRDVRATSNTIKYHLGHALTLQGTQLIQRKNTVANILQEVQQGTCRLVKYIEGNAHRGTFIGDQTEATRDEMNDLAQQMVKDTQSLNDILVNEELSDEEQQAFCNYLIKLYNNLSGTTVLDNCLAGHRIISEHKYSNPTPMMSQ